MLDAVAELAPHSREPAANHLRCGCNGPRWTVVTVWPHAERYAASNLQRQGYGCFLPLVWVSRRDRALPTLRHRVEVPMFSGYLFVQHDPRDSWTPIRTTPGVRSMLRNGNQLQYANAGAVEAVQAAVALAAATTQETPHWAPGTPCSLATGAFHGLPAVVTQVHASNANIAIMMLGHLRSVSVPLDCLRARDE